MQSEQKRFLQQHKQRSESYSKAASAMKKCRKKHKVGPKAGLAMDKEMKVINIYFLTTRFTRKAVKTNQYLEIMV